MLLLPADCEKCNSNEKAGLHDSQDQGKQNIPPAETKLVVLERGWMYFLRSNWGAKIRESKIAQTYIVKIKESKVTHLWGQNIVSQDQEKQTCIHSRDQGKQNIPTVGTKHTQSRSGKVLHFGWISKSSIFSLNFLQILSQSNLHVDFLSDNVRNSVVIFVLTVIYLRILASYDAKIRLPWYILPDNFITT